MKKKCFALTETRSIVLPNFANVIFSSIIVMEETTNYENTKFISADKTFQAGTFDQEQIDSKINRLFFFNGE